MPFTNILQNFIITYLNLYNFQINKINVNNPIKNDIFHLNNVTIDYINHRYDINMSNKNYFHNNQNHLIRSKNENNDHDI